MEHFTPLASALGGALVGLASAMVLYFQGRIAGISGIAGGLLHYAKGDYGWRFSFVLGLVSTGVIVAMSTSEWITPAPRSLPLMAVAGLLVGFGTRMANGCTSGHGVCGIGRLSTRSIAATVVFMGFAMVTVFLYRTLGGGHG